MFVMCGYDFCRDGNALNPAPLAKNGFTNTKLTNGIFDHWNVTRDVKSEYSSEIPTAWDYLTVMNANFNGNIDAGNLAAGLTGIEGFKVKRRKVGEFNWITLKYFPVTSIAELSFVFNDNLAQSGVRYEYAFVPVAGGIEGNYTTNVMDAPTKFDGVFLCDLDTVYKFYSGVSYGTQEQVQKIGVFEAFGRKYPVVVSNGAINYKKGSFAGNILPNDYLITHTFDKIAMIKERDQLLDFLTNKRAKILKDWNGNAWLCVIVDSPNINYDASSGMAFANASANWIEVGDANNQADLYNNGVIQEAN